MTSIPGPAVGGGSAVVLRGEVYAYVQNVKSLRERSESVQRLVSARPTNVIWDGVTHSSYSICYRMR